MRNSGLDERVEMGMIDFRLWKRLQRLMAWWIMNPTEIPVKNATETGVMISSDILSAVMWPWTVASLRIWAHMTISWPKTPWTDPNRLCSMVWLLLANSLTMSWSWLVIFPIFQLTDRFVNLLVAWLWNVCVILAISRNGTAQKQNIKILTYKK